MLNDRTPSSTGCKKLSKCCSGRLSGRFCSLLNSSLQRTLWRSELRRPAACSSVRSLLSAALAAIGRLFWNNSCILAPNVLSSLPSLWGGLLVLQNRSIPLLESASSDFPLLFSSVPLHCWW